MKKCTLLAYHLIEDLRVPLVVRVPTTGWEPLVKGKLNGNNKADWISRWSSAWLLGVEGGGLLIFSTLKQHENKTAATQNKCKQKKVLCMTWLT